MTITNYSGRETFTADNHPKRPDLGSRDIPFSSSVYIDADDFFDTGPDGSVPPPKGYKRLVPGGEVRLKYAYVVRCNEVRRDAQGIVTELLCTYDAGTRHGATPEGQKKVKGIIQWLAADNAESVELALYDRLFLAAAPGKAHEDGDFLKDLNPHSAEVIPEAVVERAALQAAQRDGGGTFQFERVGYFCLDRPVASGSVAQEGAEAGAGQRPGALKRFNRVVTLKDTWEGALETAAK